MRLTEDLSQVDDRPSIEAVIGEIERDEDESKFRYYYRSFEAYVFAPIRVAMSDWRAVVGGIGIVIFLFMSLVWHHWYDRAYINSAPRNLGPFDGRYMHEVFGVMVWQYPLGTNWEGRGILQMIVNASPEMMQLVLAGSVISIGIAILFGITAGYKGGFVDRVLMSITDIVLVIPGLPLIVLLTAIIEPRDPIVLGMLLAIDSWPGLARSLRSQVLTMRQESYVEASRAIGVSTGIILGIDIIPQLMPYILINAANAGRSVINQAVGLYFLGFLESSAENWGKMMDDAYQYGAISNPDQFYMIFWPMFVLAGLSFALILFAQGLDQIFNPRLRARHISHGGEDEEDEQVDPTNV